MGRISLALHSGQPFNCSSLPLTLNFISWMASLFWSRYSRSSLKAMMLTNSTFYYTWFTNFKIVFSVHIQASSFFLLLLNCALVKSYYIWYIFIIFFPVLQLVQVYLYLPTHSSSCSPPLRSTKQTKRQLEKMQNKRKMTKKQTQKGVEMTDLWA